MPYSGTGWWARGGRTSGHETESADWSQEGVRISDLDFIT